MSLYIHLGHDVAFSGSDESIIFMDKWIHLMELLKRLDITNRVINDV